MSDNEKLPDKGQNPTFGGSGVSKRYEQSIRSGGSSVSKLVFCAASILREQLPFSRLLTTERPTWYQEPAVPMRLAPMANHIEPAGMRPISLFGQRLHGEYWLIARLNDYERNPERTTVRWRHGGHHHGVWILPPSAGAVVDGHLRLKAARRLDRCAG
jgi:hypothetical protein